MLNIRIDTSSFLADNGQKTPYSKAQVLLDLMNEQMIPSIAMGNTEGYLIEKGQRVGIWKEAQTR